MSQLDHRVIVEVVGVYRVPRHHVFRFRASGLGQVLSFRASRYV